MWKFLKEPPIIFQILIYSLTIIFAILSLIFADNSLLQNIFFAGLGTFFFYAVYLFAAFGIKNIKVFIAFLRKRIKWFDHILTDYNYRTIFNAALAFIFVFIFSIYNAILGIIYQSVWYISISIYYFLLMIVRFILVKNGYLLGKQKLEIDIKAKKMTKIYLKSGIYLFLIDLVLVIPITMLIYFQKKVNFPDWIAIGMAAYTFYKLITAIVNFIKTRKSEHLIIKGLRTINFTDAMVSLLTLENTLILTFSTEKSESLFILGAILGFVIIVLCFLLAVLTIINGRKILKKNNE